MIKRIGVIGIVVENRKEISDKLNKILSSYGDIIIGRMGIPSKEYGLSIISLIVEGTSDDIGAITGKLGSLKGVNLKSALTSVKINDKVNSDKTGEN
ncbi:MULTISPECIES: TM1266 family iron-only hydrogenase system putative regulator [unclassified Halanaerobium]|uniref:TM1266 family iron-only hydrogenase system putative regulator n=1 Tax=unclassified Halanaerobium TaxID=2641197 RepID=UPI000DF4498B|nr:MULTISPECIES: TM1266 family iron-only hydrogenase system putative regulator [unclassified Halanaerobium]RCW41987.1 putative iron-only hydrogenase system regulator [Halanaerobium sp. MA284_MarDTE_T2]RCW79948.1 putative iron-only hydrogenase system regulator [Halanaerobium sp. DL-01]